MPFFISVTAEGRWRPMNSGAGDAHIRLTAGSIYSHAGKSWSLLLVVAVATPLLWLSIAEKSCYVWSVIAESSLWYAQHSVRFCWTSHLPRTIKLLVALTILKIIYNPLINTITSGHNKLWWPPVANSLSVTYKCYGLWSQ